MTAPNKENENQVSNEGGSAVPKSNVRKAGSQVGKNSSDNTEQRDDDTKPDADEPSADRDRYEVEDKE